ncbi:hypothetical protein COCMIDRAFT_92075, partial [Bipolaris oryzae ATCC 44560]
LAAPTAQPHNTPCSRLVMQPVIAELEEPSSKRSIAKLLTHLLHLISSIIVFSIVMHYYRTIPITWLKEFWAILACIDIVICILVLYYTFVRSSIPHLGTLMFVLANLWLLALTLSTIDYSHTVCGQPKESVWVTCPIKRVHMAFETLAFLLSFLTMMVEFRRWVVPYTRRWGSKKVIDGTEKWVRDPVVTPRTSYTAV